MEPPKPYAMWKLKYPVTNTMRRRAEEHLADLLMYQRHCPADEHRDAFSRYYTAKTTYLSSRVKDSPSLDSLFAPIASGILLKREYISSVVKQRYAALQKNSHIPLTTSILGAVFFGAITVNASKRALYLDTTWLHHYASTVSLSVAEGAIIGGLVGALFATTPDHSAKSIYDLEED